MLFHINMGDVTLLSGLTVISGGAVMVRTRQGCWKPATLPAAALFHKQVCEILSIRRALPLTWGMDGERQAGVFVDRHDPQGRVFLDLGSDIPEIHHAADVPLGFFLAACFARPQAGVASTSGVVQTESGSRRPGVT